MTKNGIPEGWSYDPSDSSVGIFGDGWIHEDCPLPDIEEYAEAWGVGPAVFVGTGVSRLVRYQDRLVCPCGAETTVTHVEWDPDYDEEEMAS